MSLIPFAPFSFSGFPRFSFSLNCLPSQHFLWSRFNASTVQQFNDSTIQRFDDSKRHLKELRDLTANQSSLC
jgi:hypothetical protein